MSRRGLPRSSLACLSCRSAKHKCDGLIPAIIAASTVDGQGKQHILQPHLAEQEKGTSSTAPARARAEVPCSRCERLGLVCEWKPCQRLGRPPGSSSIKGGGSTGKRRKTDAVVRPASDLTRHERPPIQPSDSNESSNSSNPSSMDPPSLDLSWSSDDSESLSDCIAENIRQTVKEFVPSPTSTGDFSSDSGFQLPENLDALIATLISSGAAFPGSEAASGPSPDSFDRSTFDSMPLFLQTSLSYSEGAFPPQYHSRAPQSGHFVSEPLFSRHGLPSDLQEGLHRYFAGVGTAIPIVGSPSGLSRRIQHVDAALLYGAASLGHILHEGHQGAQHQHMRALSIDELGKPIPSVAILPDGAFLDRITALCLAVYTDYGECELQRANEHMDTARKMALSSGLDAFDSPDRAVHAQILGDRERERARLVWSELYTLDVILDIATSAHVPRGLGHVRPAVNVPQNDEVYAIRVRAVTLLADILSDAVDANQLPRLDTLDSVLARLLAQAQMLWVSTLQSPPSAKDSLAHRKILGMRPLMQSLLILHAARVHLHRQAWFAGLTLDMTSCSFVRESRADQAPTPPQGLAPIHRDAKRLETSIAIITKSCDAILNLMQLDADLHFSRLQNALANASGEDLTDVPIIAPHWPFVGCCSMVAAFGFGIAAAAAKHGAPEHESAPQHQDILSLSQGSGMRIRRSLSSIGFAESSLGILQQVWKVAGMYRQQVNGCRRAISEICGED